MAITGADLRPGGASGGGADGIDVGGVKARIQAFDDAHGEYVVDGGWIRFADGAVREVNPLGLLSRPPDDAYKLATRILRYRELVLERAVNAFTDRKTYFVQSAKSHLQEVRAGPPPADADAAAAELKALQLVVQTAKVAVDEARACVTCTEPAGLKANRERHLQNRQANEALLERLGNIEI